MIMFNSLTNRKLYTEKELVNLQEKTEMHLKKNLGEKDYRMASFYSLDVAYILGMLHEERSINQFFLTIQFAQKAEKPLYDIITECFCNLGKFQEAFTLSLKDPYYNPLKRAYIYEKIGQKEKAHHVYMEIIDKKKKKVQSEIKFYKAHLFQEISDIWRKIGNEKESVKFNKHALEEWNKIRNSVECTHPIENAWLSEEIGYIFEKTHLFEEALDYYSTAKERYVAAWSKDHMDYSELVQVNSQWDMHYREYFFTQLFPNYSVMGFLVESYKDRDFRRIKYRILNVNEKMKLE